MCRPYASWNLQVKVEDPLTTRILLLLRHKKLPTFKSCDIVRVLANVKKRDGEKRSPTPKKTFTNPPIYTFLLDGFIDTFIRKEAVNNRTGDWYVGVMSLSSSFNLSHVTDGGSCETNGMTKDWYSKEFFTTEYELRGYTGGCYSFNTSSEVWEAIGVTIHNTTKLISACNVSHLTSFGSGWFAQVNTIDFEFIFAEASFQDNLTIYMCLIVTFTVYFFALAWACWNDRKDAKRLPVPVLLDNNPEEAYFYEIVVETGPLTSHATTSKIYFILDGDHGDTGERTFYNPERVMFNAGSQVSYRVSLNHNETLYCTTCVSLNRTPSCCLLARPSAS